MRIASITRILAAAIVVFGAGGSAAGQGGRYQAERLFTSARPHIERTLGRRLAKAPEFRRAEFKERLRVPAWDFKGYLRWRFPALPKSVRTQALDLGSHLERLAMPAEYVPGTEVILYTPECLETIAAWDDSLKGANSERFLQLAIVYEVVRRDLERRYRLLEEHNDPASLEEFRIQSALKEGRAFQVTEAVADALGTRPLAKLLALRWLHHPSLTPDARLQSICNSATGHRCWAMVTGRDFFNDLRRAYRGDFEELAFRRPPTQIAWLKDVKAYLRTGIKGPDLRRVLATIAAARRIRGFDFRQQPWTPTMLSQVAKLVEMPAESLRFADKWQCGRSLVWSQGNTPGRYIALTALVFDDVAGAKSYFGFAADLQRKRDAVAARSPFFPLRPVESRYRETSLKGFDEVLRNDKTLRAGESPTLLPMTTWLARAGNVVIELQWYSVPVDERWGSETAQLVLRAVRSASKGDD